MSDIEGKNLLQDEGDRVETLRLILEREQRKPVTYSEALEVAESLICFFEILADEAEPVSLSDNKELQRV